MITFTFLFIITFSNSLSVIKHRGNNSLIEGDVILHEHDSETVGAQLCTKYS